MDKFFRELDAKGHIVFEPELLSIKEYNDIWLGDKTVTKVNARKKLTFIWGLCCRDANNMYADYLDKNERVKMLKSDLWGNDQYNPLDDEQVKIGLAKYVERNPKNEYDEQADFKYEQIVEMRNFLRQMDKNERTDNGTLVIKPADFQKAMKELDIMVKDLDEMRTLAKEKRARESTIRGGVQESFFENADKADWL